MPSATWIANYTDGERGHWEVTKEGKALLTSIKSEVYVVGIAGAMRTGKSYIMNLLADASLPEKQVSLFDLGSTTESKTRGVWGYVRPHYKDPSKSLLILDFEGMFDISDQRLNANFDAQIFLLAVLLSSYFLYNTQMTIDADKLNKLAFVAEVGSHLNLKKAPDPALASGATSSASAAATSAPEEDGHSTFFPEDFAWLVRDFFLDLGNNTDDSYLETALKCSAGHSLAVAQSNAIRNAIKDNFKSRRCFTLPRPLADQKLLQHIDEQPFSSLAPDFRTKVRSVIDTIIATVKPKHIKDGAGVSRSSVTTTGRELLVYMESLLQQLNTSSVFCVEDAWTNVAKTVTLKAFDDAVASFTGGMTALFDKTPPPLEAATYLDAVDKCIKESMAAYTTTAILREDAELGADALKAALDEVDKALAAQNLAASEKLVGETVDKWATELMQKLETKSPELSTHDAFKSYKDTLHSKVKALKGKVGVAWNTMHTLLLKRFEEADRVAALNFALSAKEIEIAKQEADNRAMQATQAKLHDDLKATKEEQKQREERWQQVQLELQQEHEREMEEQRKAMSERMDTIAREHAEAIKRGDRALAEQKEDSQRRLTEAISGMETKHREDMQRMESTHQQSVNAMEQQQLALQGEINRVRDEAKAEADRHREEMESQKNNNNNGGYQIVYWPWFWG